MTVGLQSAFGRRILLLNWRDLSHPRAGGAEVYCQEIGERLAAAGAHVTLFTSQHDESPVAELRGGMHILRQGGTFGVYLRAAQHMLRSRGEYDAVLDFQNGIPFFAPWFAGRRTAVVCVIHHVHQEQFGVHFAWPASRIGQVLEGPVSRIVYGFRPLVAVSPSTRRDVRRRLRLRGPIHVVPNGLLSADKVPERARSVDPRIVVVSRLVAHKRFDLLLEAVAALRSRWSRLYVEVAGDGPDRPALERRAAALGLADRVAFHGFVAPEVKQRLLAAAWLTVSPSQAEGWGLTVIEANAAGVPAVAFDVPGLRDSIVHGETGWLVPPERDLGDGIDRALRVLQDVEQATAYSARCQAWARRFSWDSTAERVAAILSAEIDRVSRAPRSRRVPSDLAVRVEATAPVDRQLVDLRGTVRRTDQLLLRDRNLSLLLHGCDEASVEQVLTRLGVVDVRRIAMATTRDLLVGAAG